jgi:hypothetical protein
LFYKFCVQAIGYQKIGELNIENIGTNKLFGQCLYIGRIEKNNFSCPGIPKDLTVFYSTGTGL